MRPIDKVIMRPVTWRVVGVFGAQRAAIFPGHVTRLIRDGDLVYYDAMI